MSRQVASSIPKAHSQVTSARKTPNPDLRRVNRGPLNSLLRMPGALPSPGNLTVGQDLPQLTQDARAGNLTKGHGGIFLFLLHCRITDLKVTCLLNFMEAYCPSKFL